MEHLGSWARLDSPRSAEVAMVSVGLLAAAQVKRRLELQQQQQTTNAVHRGPEQRIFGWIGAAFQTFLLGYGGVVFIRIERLLESPVGWGTSHWPKGAPLSERLLLVALVAAACYSVMNRFSWCRPLLNHRLVKTPLGIIAELLRAGHVSAAAASTLALLPPLLPAPGEQTELRATLSTDSQVLRENVAFRCAVIGLLRLSASVLAGAAVSCFGGGDLARHDRLTRDSKTRLWLSKDSDNPREAQGGEERVSNIGRRLGKGREGEGIDGQDGEEMGAGSGLASMSWFVPSGALGAAFYTVSVEEGVFGGFFREFFFGNDWFTSPESVRLTLASVYAAVFLISEISEISGSAFNPLRPFYQLLGLENLPRSSNGVGVLLRKRFRLGVWAVPPRSGPTSPPVDDDYICERCRASGALRTGNAFEQQRKLQRKDENSVEECETVSTTSNVTASSASQVLREIRRSGRGRTLLGSSPDAAAAQAKGDIVTEEVLPSESKSGVSAGVADYDETKVADYDETKEEFSEAEKKGQQVGQWKSTGATGGGQGIHKIFGGDADLARRVSSVGGPCSGGTGGLGVDRTKKEDAPDGVRPLGLCTMGDIDAASNHDTIDGGLVKQSRNSCYARDDGCEYGEVMERNNGGEENLKACKRETDVSRGRGQGTPQDTKAFVERGARIGIGCGSGYWFWLELLETWAFFLVFLAFLVRQLAMGSNRCFWRDKAAEAYVSLGIKASLNGIESALLLGFPMGMKLSIVFTALMAAARVRSVAEKMNPTATLPCIPFGAALTCLGAFGGNILASALTDIRSLVLTEELAFPSAVGAWLVVRGRLWGTPESYPFSLRGILSLAGIHHALILLAEIFRALLVCRAVDGAKGLSGPGEVYSWSLAIIAGVLAGCGGLFLPCDRGLSPLSKGVPWAMQSALYGAVFYYRLAGTTAAGRGHAQAVVALCFSSVALARTSHRTFNPFSRIHRAVCLLLGLSTRETSAGASKTINAPTERKNIRPRSARCWSCSPIGERRVEAAAIASSAAWSNRGRRRTASLEMRNRSSISRGVYTEAGAVTAAAEAESAWPSDERWGFVKRSSSGRLSSVRGVRQISPPPLTDRGRWSGPVIGAERPRNRSIFSYSHGRDIQWGRSASVRRDQQRGSGENTLSGSSIQRGVGRVGDQGETNTACERGPSRLMDGHALGMTGVGRGMIWAAFAVSAIVVGRWLSFTHHSGNTYPSPSTDTLQPRSPPPMEFPLEARAGGMTATLGGGDNVVMEQMVCQESFEETSGSFSGSFSGGRCWEGRGGDQRCLHEGSSDDIADQEEEGVRRVSKQSSSPVLPSLRSDIEDVSEAVGKFSEISQVGVDKVSNGKNLATSDAVIFSDGHETDILASLPTPPAMETSLSHSSLVSSMLNADNTAVGSDEMMNRYVPSTVKDQPSPTTVDVRAFSTAAEDDLSDAGHAKKQDLSSMNCRDAECISGVGDSNRCTIGGGGVEEGPRVFGTPSVVDGAANMVACSSCLDGSNVASGSCLGGGMSSLGGLGVEMSDSLLACGSDPVGVEGGDTANFCTSSSSCCSCCCRSSMVDKCEGVGGVYFDSEEVRSRGVPSYCDGVLDVADRKVVRDAAAGFKADGTGSMDGMDVPEGAGAIDDPIRDSINSASRVCETSEAQSLERDPETIPGENPLSSVAPKSRPWDLPNHASVPTLSDDPRLASVSRDGYTPEAPGSPMVSAATAGAVGSHTPLSETRRRDKSDIGSVGAEQDAEAEAKPPLRDTEQSALVTNGAGETKTEACLRDEEMEQKRDTGGDGHSGFSGSMSPYQGVGTCVRDEQMLAEELSNLPAEEVEKLSEDTGSLGEGEVSNVVVTETAESGLLDREARLFWSEPCDSGTSLPFQGSFSFPDAVGGPLFCSRGVDCEASVVEGGSNLEAGDGIGGVDCGQSGVEAGIDGGEGPSCVAADPVDQWSRPLERRRKSADPSPLGGNDPRRSAARNTGEYGTLVIEGVTASSTSETVDHEVGVALFPSTVGDSATARLPAAAATSVSDEDAVAIEEVSESILEGGIGVSSNIGLEVDGADEDYDGLASEGISSVMDGVSVLSKDNTEIPPPTGENKRTAGTVVRKAVAVVAAAAYYGVWAAITIVLG